MNARNPRATPALLAATIVLLAANLRVDFVRADPVVPQHLEAPALLHTDYFFYWPEHPDREAMVELRFTVDKYGIPHDIEAIEGFYDDRFEKAAIRTLKSWRFQPARLNGQAVDYEGVSINLVFHMVDGGKLSKPFLTAMDDAVDLIKADRLEAAHEQVEEMVAGKVKWLYEYVVLQAMLAETYQKTGHPLDSLIASRRATGRAVSTPRSDLRLGPPSKNSQKNYLLPEPLLSSTLRREFFLDVSLGLTLDALNTFDELEGLAPLSSDDPMSTAAQGLRQTIASHADLIGRARIGPDGIWRHAAYRKRFTVVDVRGGKLASIHIYCGKVQREIVYQEHVDWTLPASWTGCSLTFRGEAGTEFKIVEMEADETPNSAASAAH
jgi:TonB family protein